MLGASVVHLWKLLSKDFILLVLIGCFIAIPLSFYFMSNWLTRYTYHTDISWTTFAIVSLGPLGLTLLTMSYQALRAALSNPVDSLKSE